jgi:hypothetical protein
VAFLRDLSAKNRGAAGKDFPNVFFKGMLMNVARSDGNNGIATEDAFLVEPTQVAATLGARFPRLKCACMVWYGQQVACERMAQPLRQSSPFADGCVTREYDPPLATREPKNGARGVG